MANEFKFITKEFSSTLEKDLLEEIYTLNQENIPEVGDLNSTDNFKNLLDMSYKNFYVTKANKIIAFVVVLSKEVNISQRIMNFFVKHKRILFILIESQLKKTLEEKK